MVSDISNVGISSNTLNRITVLYEQINKDRTMIASSTAASDMSSLASINGGIDVFLLQAQMAKTDAYVQNNNALNDYMAFVDSNLSSIIQVATEFKTNLVLVSSSSGATMNFVQLVENQLKTLQTILNSNYRGNYIFSGTNTSDKPCGDISTVSNLIQDIPSNNYYNGGSEVLNTEIDENFSITYGIKADNQHFKNLIGAMHMAISAFTNVNGSIEIDQSTIQSAMNLTTDSTDGIISLRAQFDSQMKLIEERTSVKTSLSSYYENSISNIIDVDISSVMVKLTGHTTALQAAFMMISRISSLSLVNYL